MRRKYISIKIEADTFEGYHITIGEFNSFYLDDLRQVEDFFDQILNDDEGHMLVGQRMYKELKKGKNETQGDFKQ